MDAEIEERTSEPLTNSQLIQLTSLEPSYNEAEAVEDSIEPNVISPILASKYLNDLEIFFEQYKNVTEDDLELFSKLKCRFKDIRQCNKSQSTILDYFTKNN